VADRQGLLVPTKMAGELVWKLSAIA
jgi:hypothetical protein